MYKTVNHEGVDNHLAVLAAREAELAAASPVARTAFLKAGLPRCRCGHKKLVQGVC